MNTNSLEGIISFINENKLARKLSQATSYSDEVNCYTFYFYINRKSDFLKKNKFTIPHDGLQTGSLSFESKEEAINKCISEFVERFSLFFYDERTVLYTSYEDLPNALNPRVYKNIDGIEKMQFNWIEGIDFQEKKKIFLPAHLVYLKDYDNDPFKLSVCISTGAASSFEKDRSLLNGIYEIIERDAFMTTYLTGAVVPKIDISTIKNEKVQYIYEQAKRNKLELQLFDITNDIGVPSYLNIIIDRSGIGPAILIGTKSSLNTMDAVIGSMEESFMGRPWGRDYMRVKGGAVLKVDRQEIKNRLDRFLLWANPEMINKLDYLLKQKEVKFRNTKQVKTVREQLEKVSDILFKKGFNIYHKDITHKIFKKYNYMVEKVIVPYMQPLYLNENEKELVIDRLSDVSKHFKQKTLIINQIPHPML